MRKYVVHVSNQCDNGVSPYMYGLDAEDDKAAIIYACNLKDEPGIDELALDELKDLARDCGGDDSPVHMIFSVDDGEVMFEGEVNW